MYMYVCIYVYVCIYMPIHTTVMYTCVTILCTPIHVCVHFWILATKGSSY